MAARSKGGRSKREQYTGEAHESWRDIAEMRILDEYSMLDRERMARWSYNQLALRQPQFSVRGLFRKGPSYVVLSDENLDAAPALDGTRIVDWFARNRAITCAISIENSVGADFVRVDELTVTELAKGKGVPLNLTQLNYSLNLVLRGTEAKISMEDIPKDQIIRIHCSSELNQSQLNAIRLVVEGFEYPAIYQVVYSAETVSGYSAPKQGIELVPSRLVRHALGKNLSRTVEFDEDFWIQRKSEIYSNGELSVDDIVDRSWTEEGQLSGLLNGSVRTFDNIRNYLTLYEKLDIVFPLSDFHDRFFAALGVTEREFVELYEMKRIRVFLPQSVNRYRTALLEELAELSPDNMILSRRLAACTLVDARRRFPFLYPSFGISERSALLKGFASTFLKVGEIGVRKWGLSIIEALSENFLDSDFHLEHKGAMGTTITGLTNLFSKTYSAITGRDAALEMLSAGSYVDWASPFNSVIVSPRIEDGYDEGHNVEILANFNSAVQFAPLGEIEKQHKIIVGILSIDDGVDVVELARNFHGSDIARFRSLVIDLGADRSINNLDDWVAAFNREVERFERKRERLREVDVSGLISAVGGVVGAVVSASAPIAGIPLASLSVLIWLQRLLYSRRNESAMLAKMYDSVEASIYSVGRSVVLVSRLKEAVRRQ